MTLAPTPRIVLVDILALAGCAGLGHRIEALVHAPRMSPVSASPFTGIRGPIRTVAANGVEASAGSAVAAPGRVLRTSARGSVCAGDREPNNRHCTRAADATVTCVPRTAAPEVTSESRLNRQQYRRSPRRPLRCGNMCNASVGFLEHVRRNRLRCGNNPAARCAMCDERRRALPLRDPFCYLGPRTTTRNALDDRGPVVSLNRHDGCKSLICRRVRRWRCAGRNCPISTPFGVLPSHPTHLGCPQLQARDWPVCCATSATWNNPVLMGRVYALEHTPEILLVPRTCAKTYADSIRWL